mgnify:CR=1 FL=1
MSNVNVKLSKSDISAIEAVLSKGNRVEIIPVENGVRIIMIRRDTVKVASEDDTEISERRCVK